MICLHLISNGQREWHAGHAVKGLYPLSHLVSKHFVLYLKKKELTLIWKTVSKLKGAVFQMLLLGAVL